MANRHFGVPADCGTEQLLGRVVVSMDTAFAMSGSVPLASRLRRTETPGCARPNNVDLALVEMVRVRNARGARAIYQHLLPAVEGSILRVLGTRGADHDDLVQLSFEQIVRSIRAGKYSGTCNLAAWSSVIATRVAFAELRRRFRRRRLFADDPVAVTNSTPPYPSGVDQTLAREQLTLVRRALSSLTPERASVVLLHDVEERQLDEVALLLGISPSAAQSRLVRGRKQFLARYRELAGDPSLTSERAAIGRIS